MNKRDVYVNAKSGRHKNRLLWWHVFWRPSVGRRTVRRPSLIFSSYPLKYLNGIDQNLTGSKIEDIFEFSETAELNLTKVDRKQYLNTIYQVCGFFFFGPIGKTRWPPCLRLDKTFSTTPLKPKTAEQNLIDTLQAARSQRPLPRFF